jgi:Putative DNA-binding domain
MPTIRKPLAEIDANDLSTIVADGWTESELLEFKETLTSTSSGASDRWLVDQSDIGQAAKRDILAEVVAMANSYGGDVIVGIEESDEKPPRAKAIKHLPQCVELAHRMEMAARDLIKPEVPMLSVRGVELSNNDGVVIFRVPRSRLAPHRLEMKGMVKECYKRVSDRTEPMSMREIQDLTFSVSRGLEAVDARFRELHQAFMTWLDFDRAGRRRGFRVSAVPLSADLFIERVHGREEIKPVTRDVNVKLNGKDLEFPAILTPYNWRPILRGTQATVEQTDKARQVQLFCDGIVDDAFRMDAPLQDQSGQRTEHFLWPGWLFGSLICAFESVDRFRRTAGATAVQYGIEVELATSAPLPVLRIDHRWFDPAGTVSVGMHPFPRYQLGDRDSWNEVFGLIWRDFWSFVGVDAHNDKLELEL